MHGLSLSAWKEGGRRQREENTDNTMHAPDNPLILSHPATFALYLSSFQRYMRLVRRVYHKESTSIELLANKLIGYEGNGLSWHDAEEARGNALPQRRRSLLLGNHQA